MKDKTQTYVENAFKKVTTTLKTEDTAKALLIGQRPIILFVRQISLWNKNPKKKFTVATQLNYKTKKSKTDKRTGIEFTCFKMI